MSVQEFKGHVGIGPEVTASPLAASDDFSARYDLDQIGECFPAQVTNFGADFVGRILVLNAASVARADVT